MLKGCLWFTHQHRDLPLMSCGVTKSMFRDCDIWNRYRNPANGCKLMIGSFNADQWRIKRVEMHAFPPRGDITTACGMVHSRYVS